MKVSIQFVGGPLDGTVVFDPFDAETPPENDPARTQAWVFYNLTDCGKVGKATVGLSPAAIDLLVGQGGDALKDTGASGQRYRVVDRKEDDNSVFVRAEHFVKQSD